MLFAGRFEDQKGVDLLPRILPQVRLHGRQCELVVHGSGAHEGSLRALASDPPAGWTIQVNGPAPNLSGRMASFDLLLMPSRYEGLSLLAIEAALLGLPVIATDGPGFREGFPPDYPWLARAGDPDSFAGVLQQALDDPAAWPGVARQAREFAEKHFDASAMCEAYGELYRQVLSRRAT
jgi:glycosyltransferase involved in cell wall biosynthesis